MIIKTIFSLVFLMATATAHATPMAFGFLKLGKNHSVENYVSRDSSGTNPQPKQCMNFTGTYTGSCDGDQHEYTLEIEQFGCVHININGRGQSIGGIHGESSAFPNFAMIGSEAVQWNDKGQLSFSDVGHFSLTMDEDYSFLGSYGYYADMDLKGKILSVEGTSTFGGNFSCHYAK